jgi:RND family efflux transporter MFP subunit
MAEEDLNKLRIEKTPVGGGARRRRPGLWLAVVVAVVLAVVLYVTGVFSPAVEVDAATVSEVYPAQTFTLLNASGYVVPQRQAAVAAKITAQLVWLGVEEGDVVQKGQLIARLEDRDLKAARNQASANLKVARSNLQSARAELNDADADFHRQKELLDAGFISRSDFDQAEARYLRAKAAVGGGEAAVHAAQAALKAAEVNLEYTRIRAPFDAVVLTKNADVGDIVTPIGAAAEAKAAVVTIADMASLQVEADVSESNLEKVKKGQPCVIQLDALPGARFDGAVHMIVPTADRTKATVMVKVSFARLDPRILPEMSVRVAFLSHPVAAGEKKPRTAVSQAAVVTRDGRKLVFRLEGQRAVAVPVETGMEMGDMIEITRGVVPGDKVIVSPLDKVRNGTRVKMSTP